jgi:beta-catenin-like protein 1
MKFLNFLWVSFSLLDPDPDSEYGSETLLGISEVLFFYREKKKSRSGALRVLDHAMTGPEGADNCIKFVDVLGLRSLFPLFMKTPKKTKRAGERE